MKGKHFEQHWTAKINYVVKAEVDIPGTKHDLVVKGALIEYYLRDVAPSCASASSRSSFTANCVRPFSRSSTRSRAPCARVVVYLVGMFSSRQRGVS